MKHENSLKSLHVQNQSSADRRAQTARQIQRLRTLYSQIGEPLPVDILFDLHLHLGSALELHEGAPQRSLFGKNSLKS